MSVDHGSKVLTCDGKRTCDNPVTYTDSKGYLYCTKCAYGFKAAGRIGVRKLRASDKAMISLAVQDAQDRENARAANGGEAPRTIVSLADIPRDSSGRIL